MKEKEALLVSLLLFLVLLLLPTNAICLETHGGGDIVLAAHFMQCDGHLGWPFQVLFARVRLAQCSGPTKARNEAAC